MLMLLVLNDKTAKHLAWEKLYEPMTARRELSREEAAMMRVVDILQCDFQNRSVPGEAISPSNPAWIKATVLRPFGASNEVTTIHLGTSDEVELTTIHLGDPQRKAPPGNDGSKPPPPREKVEEIMQLLLQRLNEVERRERLRKQLDRVFRQAVGYLQVTAKSAAASDISLSSPEPVQGKRRPASKASKKSAAKKAGSRRVRSKK